MYEIQLTDDITFRGGLDLTKSQWNDMPVVPIYGITYSLFNHIVELKGYDAYNHLVERSRFLENGKELISKVILLTKKDNNLMAVIFDLINRTVYSEPRNISDFYNTTGWKRGITNQFPSCNIF